MKREDLPSDFINEIESLKHSYMSIQSEIEQAIDDGANFEQVKSNISGAMIAISEEALGWLETLFGREEEEEEDHEMATQNNEKI